MERTTNQPVDATPGDPTSGTVEKTITQSGFDISGADLLMLGTLYKNITFGFVPTVEDGEGVGIEAAFVRFDNLGKSRWANLKFGKFELDNMLSEKRSVMLSSNGSFYQSYHFVPVGDGTDFGLGDNQIGAEWLGHSANSYTRVEPRRRWAAPMACPGLQSGKSYDAMFTLSQAFDAGQPRVSSGSASSAMWASGPPSSRPRRRPDPRHRQQQQGVLPVRRGRRLLPRQARVPAALHARARTTRTSPGAPRNAHRGTAACWRRTTTSARSSSSPSGTRSSGCPSRPTRRLRRRWATSTPSRSATAGIRSCSAGPGSPWLGELSFTKTIGTVPLSGDGVGRRPARRSTTPVQSTSVLLGTRLRLLRGGTHMSRALHAGRCRGPGPAPGRPA